MASMIASAGSGRSHHTSLPIFSPGFFMSRTSMRLPSLSKSTHLMRVISSCRRVEKIAKAMTRCIGTEEGRRIEEMRHQLVEFVQRRPAIAVAALLGQPQLLRDNHRIAHRALVQLIVPGRAGHCEDRAEM